MIVRLLALVLLLAAGGARAQALVNCDALEATAPPGMMPASAYAVSIEGGMVRRVVLTLADGQRTSTEFAPMAEGVSVRLVTFPDGRDPTRVTAVFNRAVVSAGGTVLVETWVRQPEDAAPTHNFYRLRCPGGGRTK